MRFVPAIFIAAIGIWSLPFLLYVPHDYWHWLLPWWQHIITNGRIAAFSRPFANYTPPYLYLLSATTLTNVPPLIGIKLLGTIGAIWLAYSVFRLTGRKDAAAATFLLPTLILNVPFLAQADCFWAAPCVLAVAAAIDGDMIAMVAWASVGFAFKAQAVFIAPFIAAVLISHRAPIWVWLLPAPIYAVFMLPAWLAGWPSSDLATIYMHQARWVTDDGTIFVSNAANWWAVFGLANYDLASHSFWIGYILAAASSIAFAWHFRSIRSEQMIPAAAFSAMMVPFLLPGMHERFFFLAEILTFSYAVVAQTRESILSAVFMQAALLLAVAGWKTDRAMLAVAGCPLVIVSALLLIGHRMQMPLGRGRQAEIGEDAVRGTVVRASSNRDSIFGDRADMGRDGFRPDLKP